MSWNPFNFMYVKLNFDVPPSVLLVNYLFFLVFSFALYILVVTLDILVVTIGFVLVYEISFDVFPDFVLSFDLHYNEQ